MKLYRIGQAEKETGWSRQWLHELIKRGEVKVVRKYGLVFIPDYEVERLRKRKIASSN